MLLSDLFKMFNLLKKSFSIQLFVTIILFSAKLPEHRDEALSQRIMVCWSLWVVHHCEVCHVLYTIHIAYIPLPWFLYGCVWGKLFNFPSSLFYRR